MHLKMLRGAWVGALLIVLVSLASTHGKSTAGEGIYCGDRNCYDVLGVKENASPTAIINSYRRIAREWHPDKNAHRREEAERMFSGVSHAYDILKGNVSRRDYDYALKHPEKFAYNHYRYYRGKALRSMRFNPILVVLFGLGLWSIFQWFSRSITHRQAIESYKDTQEWKMALKRFKEEKLKEMEKSGEMKRKMNGKRTRQEIDAVIVDERELEEQIVVRGGHRKPKFTELAIVQFFVVPYHLFCGVKWQLEWVYKYNIQKREYSQEAKEYITRTFFTISPDTWEGLDDKRKGKLMEREIWVPENEVKWRQLQKEHAKRQRGDDFDSE